jgi:hypothetical protein
MHIQRTSPRQAGHQASRYIRNADAFHDLMLPFYKLERETKGGALVNIGPIIGRVQKIGKTASFGRTVATRTPRSA